MTYQRTWKPLRFDELIAIIKKPRKPLANLQSLKQGCETLSAFVADLNLKTHTHRELHEDIYESAEAQLKQIKDVALSFIT